ncbi:MAG: UDP-N-acetylmuramoyl-L-alanyl-D-glutamate--2,6-diaminopimelate ligase [Pseudomonadota bacterium]
MRLAELLDGFATVDDRSLSVDGLTLDSRSVRPGDLFVALAGGQRHGLEFAADAVSRGCAAVIWEPATDRSAPQAPGGLPSFAIPHLRASIGEIASRFFGRPSAELRVVGVTGTNGKSSFVHLLARAFGRRSRAGTLGTLGVGAVGDETSTTHTTPDAVTVQRLLRDLADDSVRDVAMEVSSHALDQRRVDGVAFRGAVFTNLTRDHLDYHGTMDAYAEAKARLMSWPSLEFAILNADDPAVQRFRDRLAPGARCIEYGLAEGAVRGSALRYSPAGTRYRLEMPAGTVNVSTRLLGRFNVYNALAVAATLSASGWSLPEIHAALEAAEPVPGRMQAIALPGQPVVVVDYAHTPDALEHALRALREHGLSGRLICVFGCGGDRDRGKRPQMGRIAEALADRIIVTDDNPRTEAGDAIVADILEGLRDPSHAIVERDRAQAIATAVALGGQGDLVLVAGKGHETYQEVDGERHDFDDREVARRSLEAVT